MDHMLYQLYNETEEVLRERQDDVSSDDVMKGLRDAMVFLFQQDDGRPDSGFEDRHGRFDADTPEPAGISNVDVAENCGYGLGAHIKNEMR